MRIRLAALGRRLAVFAIAVVAVVAGSTGPANAAGEAVGSGTVYVGPAPAGLFSRGYASWNAGTRVVTIRATGYSMAAGKCMTTWFDWRVSNGHFDARAVRMCHNGTGTRQGISTETAGSDFSFLGVQKFAACYGNNNTTQGCVNSPSATDPLGTVDPVFDRTNWTTRWWLVDASGRFDYFDGGNSRRSGS